jgi:hypothetical protein
MLKNSVKSFSLPFAFLCEFAGKDEHTRWNMEDSNSAMTFTNFARSWRHGHHLRGQFLKESPGGVCVILVLGRQLRNYLVIFSWKCRSFIMLLVGSCTARQ